MIRSIYLHKLYENILSTKQTNTVWPNLSADSGDPNAEINSLSSVMLQQLNFTLHKLHFGILK